MDFLAPSSSLDVQRLRHRFYLKLPLSLLLNSKDFSISLDGAKYPFSLPQNNRKNPTPPQHVRGDILA